VYSAQVITQEIYPELVNIIRELAGGGVIMLPSSVADFANPELAAYSDRTQKSPVTDSTGRVKFMKLAWDALGSEFASRHVQYEMFYAGAQFVTRGHMFRTYDWDNATGLLDDLLGRYGLPAEGGKQAAAE
jgi:4-hydroxyphenylacetate 3-monooxygenase